MTRDQRINKEVEFFLNLKFHNIDLVQIKSAEDWAKECGGGIANYGEAHFDLSYETQLVEKMKMVRSVVESSGSAAVDKYEALVKYPDEHHPLAEIVKRLQGFSGEDFSDWLIPMDKSEFNFWLKVYNRVYGRQ